MELHVLLRRHRRWRLARVLMYSVLMCAGALATFFPSSLVEGTVGNFVVYAWSVGMLVSAGGCLYGSVRDQWFGEYAFLPLLFSTMFLYGASAIWAANSNQVPLVAYGLVLIAFGLGLIARWQDTKDEKNSCAAEADYQ